jgi:cytochrome c
MNIRAIAPLGAAAIVTALYFASGYVFADPVSKDEAVAMVQKAVAAIKSEGPEKAYAEISNPSGKFVDRDLYIVVYGLDGVVLAHGANASRVGTNQIDDKDPDGKAFGERLEPRRHINPGAVNVLALGDDLAEIDAHAEQETPVGRHR